MAMPLPLTHLCHQVITQFRVKSSNESIVPSHSFSKVATHRVLCAFQLWAFMQASHTAPTQGTCVDCLHLQPCLSNRGAVCCLNRKKFPPGSLINIFIARFPRHSLAAPLPLVMRNWPAYRLVCLDRQSLLCFSPSHHMSA